MQALWHELLLALVGHPGDCVQPVLRQDDVAGDDSADPSYTVVGLELVSEVPFVSGADRAAVNQLLRCGYHYTGLLHFTQSVDEGATLDAYAMPAASSLLTAARTAEDVRRLDAQQSRSVYSAASQMLSPPKLRRDAMERERTQEGSNDGKQMEAVRKDALVPVPMHPLLEDSKPKPKAVGLYLRALVTGLDEILTGYRSLILQIEQEMLSEAALEPASSEANYEHRVEFGLAKMNLMLRQYAVVLPALHSMVDAISSAKASEHTSGSSPSFTHPSIHGCSLISFLHHHSQTGVPLLSQVYRLLLLHLDKVMLHQLIHWMFHGIILDPFDEFFIRATSTRAADADTNDGRTSEPTFPNLGSLQLFHLHTGASSSASSDAFDWDRSFEVVISLLPREYFQSMTVVHQILFLGKAVKILQRGERTREERERHADRRRQTPTSSGHARNKSRRTASMASINSPTAITPYVPLLTECQPLLAQFHSLRSGSGSGSTTDADDFLASIVRFESLVDDLTRLMSRRLYHCLLDDHGLLAHLDHLRRFVLLSDGDFATTFLGLAAPTLDRPPTTRTEKDLSGASGPLRTSLQQVGLALDGDEDEEDELVMRANYPLRHLRFGVDSSLGGPTVQSAWKQLSFSYPVPTPLDLILVGESMEKYNALFRFQLEARRVQLLLRNMWTPMQSLRGVHVPGPAREHLPSLLLRQNMSFVLDALCAYMQMDVVHVCWAEMTQKLSRATDFESVRKAHEDYLNDITGHCFLRDRVVSGALSDLFDTCLQFCRSYPLSPSSFSRLSAEWDRQSCFLFTVLSRKTDFSGGSSSLLHALVWRLDYNGFFTRQSRDLGLNRQNKLVPVARGTVTSSSAIQSSLSDDRRGQRSAASDTRMVTAASVGGATRAPAAAFTPAYIVPQATYFASRPGSAQPTANTNGAAAYAAPTRPYTTNGRVTDSPDSY